MQSRQIAGPRQLPIVGKPVTGNWLSPRTLTGSRRDNFPGGSTHACLQHMSVKGQAGSFGPRPPRGRAGAPAARTTCRRGSTAACTPPRTAPAGHRDGRHFIFVGVPLDGIGQGIFPPPHPESCRLTEKQAMAVHVKTF